MATDNDPFQAPSTESRAAGYERSGVSIKGLAIFAVCLIVFAAAIHAGVWFLYAKYIVRDESKNLTFSALADEEYVKRYNREYGTEFKGQRDAIPPAPRIQPTPGLEPQNVPDADLQQMFHQEDAFFVRLGWMIDSRSHVQLKIPDAAIRSVITDESSRQKASDRNTQ